LNKIIEQLISLNIASTDSFIPFHPRTRDRADIAVLRCSRSGVMVLANADATDRHVYEDRDDLSYWNAATRQEAKNLTWQDDERRADQFGALLRGKTWLDVGTGLGALLDLMDGKVKSMAAVEPQSGPRRELAKLGYQTFQTIEDVPSKSYDIITLFHVFEHIPNPLEALRTISSKLVKGGKLVMEVPHARDALISWYGSEPFKNFTFWSEHLILHTRESLRAFVRAAGFENLLVEGYQRYPLSNHLHWLAQAKPGGHLEWGQFQDSDLDSAYHKVLSKLDLTDTLILTATLP